MNLTKKLVTGAMTASMVIPMMSPMTSVFAVGAGTKDTPVTFSVDSIIPDPENPTDPQYGIQIPTAVAFTADKLTVDTTVSMIKVNDADGNPKALPTDKQVEMSVTSANAYILKNGADTLGYTAKYAKILEKNAADQVIGTLDTTVATEKLKLAGTATLDKFDASKVVMGTYTDTLTYTATVK